MTTATPSVGLSPGTLVGPYEVLAFVDRGGMGEVYRARDTRLDREVALKILPRESSNDAKRRERFEQEARILSSLNHPSISAIYDIGEHDGRMFLVMEFVDGQPLDVWLAERPMPARMVASLGAQIADALAAAHRRGFVHRDLKPSNLMVTSAGIKLLDFGIAKLLTEPVSPSDQLRQTTVSDAGDVPGTTPYSAPEQLDGRPVDSRADVFALGVVLFEMLTGRRPFESTSKAGLIVAILEKPPRPLGLSPDRVPEHLEELILKCLEKDPDARWQNAQDLSSELARIAKDLERPAVASTRRLTRWGMAVAGVVTLAAVGTTAAVALFDRPRAPPPVFRFTIAPPANIVTSGTKPFEIAPDGRHVALVGSVDGGPSLLWIQALDSYAAQPVQGSDGAWHPFWSPDGRSVAFFSGTKLKVADVSTGVVRMLADLPDSTRAWSGAWGRGVLIVGSAMGRYTVSESGGPLERLRLVEGDRDLRSFALQFLPDGRHLLLRSAPNETGKNIYVASIDTGQATAVMAADSQVNYVQPGYLLFMRDRDLLVQRFDPETRATTGEPMHVPEAVSRSTVFGLGIFSASQSGVLAYEADAIMTQLVWHDRQGRRLGTLGVPGLYTNPALAADGQRVLVTRVDQATGGSDIWLLDRQLGSRAVTASPGNEDYPLWSPDGRAVVFASDRTGEMRMFEKPAASPAADVENETLVTDGTPARENNWPMDWSSSGRLLLFQGGGGSPGIPPLLFALQKSNASVPTALFGDRPWRGFIQEASQPRLSPDERWLAYVADIGGAPQVYVRSLSDAGRVWQVSTGGGYEPKWRGDGRELFYVAPSREVMAVDVRCSAECSFGVPHPLFRVPSIGAPLRKGSIRNEYEVTGDGQRFLVNEPVDGVAAYSIRIVLNWIHHLGS